ncbi:MAG: hypothetical protein HS108_03210 [Planctomycetes bacterium]|jgi:hypothetical protein|nr:hypothetical protein [Planctomycetota bacterium]MCL4728910.1 hypothetical protein [Planctomycetota bacterium]
MTRAAAWLVLVALACGARAQAIDAEASRFLGEPWARPGTCAPYRLHWDAVPGATARIEVHWGHTVLAHEVATPDRRGVAVLPVPVAEDVKLVLYQGETITEHRPRLPSRAAAASHAQPYVAVFAGDPLYARAVLPTEPGSLVADYFDLADFFTDWRLADGYDALVLLHADESRLPPGAQRTIAEFCSLGGAVFVAGSFRFGEQAQGIPAPGDPVPAQLRDVTLQRFEFGAGAVYRCEWEVLRRSRSARAVVKDAIMDHLWAGAATAPGGPAPSRAVPATAPWLEPGPLADGAPGALFWVLACALVAGCAVLPLVARRLSPHLWLAPVMVAGFAGVIGALSLLQTGPAPLADGWIVARTGPRHNGPVSVSAWVVADPAVSTWVVNLDAPGPRLLPRPVADVAGRPAWLADLPLASPVTGGQAARLDGGRVDGVNFRDFALAARNEGYGYTRQQGRLLEWWLEANAWRGRSALLMPAQAAGGLTPPGCAPRVQGAIAITPLRGDNK